MAKAKRQYRSSRSTFPTRLRPSISPVDEGPSWQHGYRTHGYWIDDGTHQVGHVYLPPPFDGGAAKHGYGWEVAGPLRKDLRGRCRTLREAKRAVEVGFRKLWAKVADARAEMERRAAAWK